MSDPVPRAVANLRGLSRLAVAGVLGVTDVVDRMHHEIARSTRLVRATRDGRTAGIAGAAYGTVRAVTSVVGVAAEAGLGVAAAVGRLAAEAPARARSAPEAAATDPEHIALLAGLNGLFGDHLADSRNPLAIPMTLRHEGRAVDLDDPVAMHALASSGRRAIVLVHGLCMHEGQWRRRGISAQPRCSSATTRVGTCRTTAASSPSCSSR